MTKLQRKKELHDKIAIGIFAGLYILVIGYLTYAYFFTTVDMMY